MDEAFKRIEFDEGAEVCKRGNLAFDHVADFIFGNDIFLLFFPKRLFREDELFISYNFV